MSSYSTSRIRWALILSVMALILLSSRTAQATRYYVSNGTTGGMTGNDSNTGDSLAPWLTMRKACQTLIAGDTVLIYSGRYDETSARSGDAGSPTEFGLAPVNSGSAGHPIVFKGYGPTRPIHVGKGANSSTGFRCAANLDGNRYITFDYIEFRFGYRGVRPTGNASDIIVRNCVIDSTLGPLNNNNGGFVTFNNSYGDVRRCIVENCEIFHNGDVSGYVAFNTSGIHIYAADSMIFRNNTIHHQEAGIHIKGELCDSTKWIEVYGNTVYNTVEGAYWVGHTGMQKDINFHHNVAYNVAGSGFNGAGMIINEGGTSCPSAWDLRRIKVYNNTFDCGGSDAGLLGRFGPPSDSIEIFNNIFHRPGLGGYGAGVGWKCESGYPGHVFEDYNLFYGRGDGVYFIYPQGTSYTITGWRAANPTGILANHGSHSTEADPLFANSPAHDYRLQAGSPALTGGRGGIYPTYRGAFAAAGLTVNLTATPTCLPTGGGTTTLSWGSTNADSVVIRNQATGQRISGSGPVNGSASVSMTVATTYTATAYKLPNTSTAQVTVTTGCNPPPTVTLTANPTSLPAGGGTSTLNWSSTNADSVVIRDQNNARIAGSGPTSGSTSVSLSSTSTYTATAYKVPNTATAQVTVTVAAAGNDNTAPASTALAISNTTLDPVRQNVTLRWAAPGDDGATGTANRYDLRYSTSLITSDASFNAATQVAGEPTPRAAGNVDSMIVTNLDPNQVYYFALKTGDEVPNWSTLSNTVNSENRAVGRTATVSGTYAGYSAAPLTDGVIAPRSSAATWASDQSTQPHWVEIDFGATRPVNGVRIYWAWNSARSAWMVSQQYTIQRWNGSAYVDVVTVNNPTATDSFSVTVFPTVNAQRMRIYQPANMGPVLYQTIMWQTEIKIEYDTIPPGKVNDLGALPDDDGNEATVTRSEVSVMCHKEFAVTADRREFLLST